MPTCASEIETLRDEITAKVGGLTEFAGINVLSRKTGDLQNAIERDLGRLGVACIVMIPQAIAKPRQSQRPVLDPVKVRLRCIEDKLINLTGKSALYLSERGLAGLQMWQPTTPGASLLIPVEPGILEINLIGKPDEDAQEDYAGYDVFFETKLALSPAV